MKVVQELLPGAFLLKLFHQLDDRGAFVKTFHVGEFEAADLPTNWKEAYFSRSLRGVIRGMHFQAPPHEHWKLVSISTGRIRDVVLDLRKGSSSYLKHVAIELRAEDPHAVVIAPGFAHGFAVLSDSATTHYMVTSTYAASHDAGVRWDSFGCDWHTEKPIISERDSGFPCVQDFRSPFD